MYIAITAFKSIDPEGVWAWTATLAVMVAVIAASAVRLFIVSSPCHFRLSRYCGVTLIFDLLSLHV
jgi:hypothetical protein